MIKLIVSNMSCGHCQIKINAELKANSFKVLNIDMNKNSVLIDTNSSNVSRIIKILDNINYVIKDPNQIQDILEHTIWDDKLDDDINYEKLLSFLENSNIEVVGFNDVDFGLIILSTKFQLEGVLSFVEKL